MLAVLPLKKNCPKPFSVNDLNILRAGESISLKPPTTCMRLRLAIT